MNVGVCAARAKQFALFGPLLAFLLVLACPAAQAQLTTAQYGNERTGANLRETILTPPIGLKGQVDVYGLIPSAKKSSTGSPRN